MLQTTVPFPLDQSAPRLWLAHSETSLTRGLDVDEHVVILDAAGDYHLATVRGLDFTLYDTLYDVSLDRALEPAEARGLVDSPSPAAITTNDVAALLRELGRTVAAA